MIQIKDKIVEEIYLSKFDGINYWFTLFLNKKIESFKDRIYAFFNNTIQQKYKQINIVLLDQVGQDSNFLFESSSKQYINHYSNEINQIFFEYKNQKTFTEEEMTLIFAAFYIPVFNYFYSIRYQENYSIEKLITEITPIISLEFDNFRDTHLKLISQAIKLAEGLLKYTLDIKSISNYSLKINWASIESESKTKILSLTNNVGFKESLNADGNIIVRTIDNANEDQELVILYLAHQNTITKVSLIVDDLKLRERLILDIRTQLSKVSIVYNNIVQIYLRGFPEPESIIFSNYDSALEFVNLITTANEV